MNKWQTIAQKAKTSEDWLSKAEVAAQLGCSEDQVVRTLKHALDSGEVETKKIMIVSKSGKMVQSDCFRINRNKDDKSPVAPVVKTASATRLPYKEGTRVSRSSGNYGIMLRNGQVKWADGRITTPKGSSLKKIKPA
jgi:hypothetical protein